MKKLKIRYLITFTTVIIGWVLIVIACTKQDEFIPNSETIDNKNNPPQPSYKAADLTTLYYYVTWYYDPSCQCMMPIYWYMFCEWPSHNCLPEVVVVANSEDDETIMAELFIQSYQEDSIPDFFENQNYRLIFPLISDSIANKIINEEIALYHSYNEQDSTNYYIGLPSSVQFSENWGEWMPDAEVALRIKVNDN